MPRLSEVVKGHNRAYPNSVAALFLSCIYELYGQGAVMVHSGLGQRRVLHTIRWQGYHSTFR